MRFHSWQIDYCTFLGIINNEEMDTVDFDSEKALAFKAGFISAIELAETKLSMMIENL